MIPAEQLAEVRTRHELVEFLTASGVKLRRHGTDYLGFCPFHDDRRPSLSVSPSKQYWCCLGACSTPTKKLGGDVIEFARKLWGLSFRETVQRLGGQTTTEINTTRPKLRVVKRATASAPPDLLTQVVTYYHQTLSSSLRAKEYLTERGITNPDVVMSLLIGYADGSLMERAPEGSETHAALTARGVITGKGKELLEGCLVVPLRDLHGNVVSVYGRAVDRDQHLYLPGPRRGLVNAQNVATTDEIIITESIIDALSFLEAGITNVVPMYGANGWTSGHDDLLEHHRIRRVILALDNDQAGYRASAALAGKLSQRGLDVRVVELPAKDANELLVREGAKALSATWQRLLAEPVIQTVQLPITPTTTAAKEEAAALTSSSDEEKPEVNHDAEAGAYIVSFGSRTYRVRGLSAFGVDRMRVNVRVEDAGRFHVDTFDLYSARSRKNFIESAGQALAGGPAAGAVLARQIAVLIDVLETQRLILRSEGKSEGAKPVMSIADRDEAMSVLRDPKLLDRLREDFEAVGCVGEHASMLIGYLASISRKLSEPLAILFCARSGAGKSNMQDRITDFIPPEDLVRYTRITGQALFYQDENALKHKVLALDEEGGATDAIYSLRILQSSGTLSVSATRTDPQTGKHRAEHYEVHGPTSIFLTTAHPEALDYETRNRFVLLTADESSEQTRRILERQRWGETLEGLIAKKKRDALIRRHRDVQRLIEPLHVVNPHAPSLTFPSGRLILRREQKKYLTLIKVIALLHQHQRRRKSIEIAGERIDYIEVTTGDIELAQQLAPSILRRNLDELAPPTRALLDAIRAIVATKMKELKVPREYAHVSRHELQQHTGLSYWHLRVYLQQLVECEHLVVVRSENGKRYLYELLDDRDGEDPASEIAR